MTTKKMFITLGLALASVIVLPTAKADEYDQASKLTFNKSIQIPGHVLPAGTYWFVLANINSRDVVQVFNSDRSMLLASVITINAERLKSTDHTAMTFAERGEMQPETVLSWYYPAERFGHEFLYPKPEEQELARAKQRTVMVG
jgi:hypothetical protein